MLLCSTSHLCDVFIGRLCPSLQYLPETGYRTFKSIQLYAECPFQKPTGACTLPKLKLLDTHHTAIVSNNNDWHQYERTLFSRKKVKGQKTIDLMKRIPLYCERIFYRIYCCTEAIVHI